MKYCPNCHDFALYEDDINNCPLCNAVLRTYIFDEEEIQYQDVHDAPSFEDIPRENTAFRQTNGLYTQYHGSIVSVEHYHRIYPFFIKIIRSLFLNEPFQFGYLTYYTNIIIEENRYDTLPENQVSLTYCGDIMGRVYTGETVDIRTKLNRNRIASIRNSDNRMKVKPAFSLPGWSLWLVIAMIPVLIPLVIELGLTLLSVLIYPILIIFILYYIIRAMF